MYHIFFYSEIEITFLVHSMCRFCILSFNFVLSCLLGGVRCERASSYMRSKGIERVYQLSGGIHAYLEEYPDGGYFRGKNFVFDPRIALPPAASDEVVGTCRICATLYDDYAAQIRCSHCRMLQLVCDTCRVSSEEFLKHGVVCQFCEDNGSATAAQSEIESNANTELKESSDRIRNLETNNS